MLREYLTAQLPAGLQWEIAPDRECTIDQAGSDALRAAYEGLIVPFEQALMLLRRDGAEALDPRAKVWKWEGNLLVGTFDLWLCDDPDRPHTWLAVTVGFLTEPLLFDEEPAARPGHFGFTSHHPLLFLPRPPGLVTFTARAESCLLPGCGTSRVKVADSVASAHLDGHRSRRPRGEDRP
ncbi:hypothetical protein ACFY2N_07135 [Streptomyces rubiginosohelvolus]|uniref:hypothetical protein n=1 Tax=Streptomyces rubiginosohelvolus TaxID=67362 RepID=UPI00367C1099